MTVEAQIVKVTKVKETAYRIRQDYLAALVRGIDKLSQDEWDNLSDDVVNWHIAAVGQMDKKRPIADFPETENAFAESFIGSEGEEDATISDKDSDGMAEAEETSLPAPSVGSKGNTTESEDTEQAEEIKEKKPRGRPKKVKEVKPKKESEWPEKFVNKPEPERYAKITGERDRFGITIGTKTSDAVAMYHTADGATLKQVDKAIGGRHFNILGKLAKDGHKVEKLAGGFWRVTHKDD